MFRMVVDMRKLNAVLEPGPWKGYFTSIKHVLARLQQHRWFLSRDISDAYFHITVHPDSRLLLCFQWKGVTWRFRTLPFGLSCSPFIFTEVMDALVRKWIEIGLEVIAYYDDLTITAATQDQCLQQGRMLAEQCQRLGIYLDEVKGNVVPTQVGILLGFHVDAERGLLGVPAGKLQKIQQQAMDMAQRRRASPRQLYSLASKVVAYQLATTVARARTHSLYRAARGCRSWDTMLALNDQVMEDLQWLAQRLPEHAQRRFRWEIGSVWTVTTDASGTGWGAVLERLGMPPLDLARPWATEAEEAMSSNLKETCTAQKALAAWAASGIDFKGHGLTIRSDNATAISYLRKGGGPVITLDRMARQLWDSLVTMGLELVTVQFLAGKNNGRADRNSRAFALMRGPRLKSKTVERLERQVGPLTPWPWNDDSLWTGALGLLSVPGSDTEQVVQRVVAQQRSAVLVVQSRFDAASVRRMLPSSYLARQLRTYNNDFKDGTQDSSESNSSATSGGLVVLIRPQQGSSKNN
jgi:hypothetical protein